MRTHALQVMIVVSELAVGLSLCLFWLKFACIVFGMYLARRDREE